MNQKKILRATLTIVCFFTFAVTVWAQTSNQISDQIGLIPEPETPQPILDEALDDINVRLTEVEKNAKNIKSVTNRIDIISDLNTKKIVKINRQSENNASVSLQNREKISGQEAISDLHGEALILYKESINQALEELQKQKNIDTELERKVTRVRESAGLDKTHLNRFWMLLSALLVFFMQAGFKVYEVGLVRMRDRNSVGIKNLLDWIIVSLVFYLVGFGLMFGESSNGWLGMSFFGAEGIEESNNELGYEFFLFQIAFAATAATIVSGALAVRTMLFSYLILAFFIGAFVYPIFGHWAWGHIFVAENKPWLASIGFYDFAGGTVVHSLGAWIALVGCFFIRPRIGKYIDRDTGLIAIRNIDNFRPYDLSYSVLGVFILWVGWWGFNGGSTLFVTVDETNAFSNTHAPSIILNTSLAGSAGGLIAFLHSYFLQNKKFVYEKLMGGTLAGLVAITPCADVVSVSVAIFVVGIGAGLLHNIVFDRLNEKTFLNRIIDDPVGAIAIHGPPGVFGTLCVALGEPELIKSALGQFYPQDWTRASQFGDQLFGVVVCFLYTISFSIVIFTFLQKTLGLEVSLESELQGDILGLPEDGKQTNTDVVNS